MKKFYLITSSELVGKVVAIQNGLDSTDYGVFRVPANTAGEVSRYGEFLMVVLAGSDKMPRVKK